MSLQGFDPFAQTQISGFIIIGASRQSFSKWGLSGGDRLSVSSSAVACSEHSGQAFDLKSKRRYFELKVLWLKQKRFPALRAKHWTLSYCIYCTAHVIPHELQCSKMFTCLIFWSSTCNAFISNLLRLGL